MYALVFVYITTHIFLVEGIKASLHPLDDLTGSWTGTVVPQYLQAQV